MEIDVKVKLRIPAVPNFILLEGAPGAKQDGFIQGPTIPVGDLTDDQLYKIASEWTSELLATAKRQRGKK